MTVSFAGWHSLATWQADAPRIEQAEAGDVEATLAAHGRLRGTCRLCGRDVHFGHPSTSPDLREGLSCGHCGCNARQRAAAMVMLDALEGPRQADVYVTEQASPLFVALRRRMPRLLGSEYAQGFGRRLRLSTWLWRHGVVAWVGHGDATALRFGDASLDGVLSLDVLEHVPDHRAALAEFVRVLRPGAVLVLTVPFYDRRAATREIARRHPDGGIEHFGDPEYHGDPLGGGVVCFRHFGWDLCESLREAGFREARAYRVSDPGSGLPRGQWVFRARR